MVAAGALTLILAGPVSAFDGWAGPTRLSGSAGSLYSMAIDTAGRHHIAYEDQHGIHYLSNRSGTWVDRHLTTHPGDVRPSLALDGAGHVYIAFDRNAEITGGGKSSGIYYLTDRSGEWRLVRRTTGAGDVAPSLAIRDGKLHLVFARDSSGIIYQTNASGSWTSRRISYEPRLAHSFIDPRLTVRLDAAGTVHVVYSGGDTSPPGIRYVRGSGSTWTRTMLTDGTLGSYPDGVDYRARMALDGDGKIHVVWIHDVGSGLSRMGVFYGTNRSGTFRYTFLGGDGFPNLTVTKSGRPHVVFSDDAGIVYGTRVYVDGKWQWRFTPLYTIPDPDWGHSAAIRLDAYGKPRIVYSSPGSGVKGECTGTCYFRKL